MRLRTVRKIGRLISQCVIFQPKVRIFTDIEILMILLTSHAGFLASHEPVGDLGAGKRRKIVNIYLFQIIVHISGSGARWATKNWMVNTFIKTGLLQHKSGSWPQGLAWYTLNILLPSAPVPVSPCVLTESFGPAFVRFDPGHLRTITALLLAVNCPPPLRTLFRLELLTVND